MINNKETIHKGNGNGGSGLIPFYTDMFNNLDNKFDNYQKENASQHSEIHAKITVLEEHLKNNNLLLTKTIKYGIYIIMGLFATGAMKPEYLVDLINILF